jgi:hypothetical protein
MNQLLSLSNTDKDYFFENQKKFDHVSCRFNGTRCKSALASINQNYTEYNYYRSIKAYSQSIIVLKNAFNKTSEINKPACKKCAEYFRATITESLEDVHSELKKMSTGIFKTKRHNLSYIEATNTLIDFKNSVHVNTIKINNQEENAFKTYAQKNVV